MPRPATPEEALDLLRSPGPGRHQDRRDAVAIVVRNYPAEAVAELIARIEDPSEHHSIKEEAAFQLGQLGAAESVEPLVRALQVPYGPLKTTIKRSLILIGEPSREVAEEAARSPSRSISRIGRTVLAELDRKA